MSGVVAFHPFCGQMFKHKTRSVGEDVQWLKIPKKGLIGPFLGLFDNFIPAFDSSCDHRGPFASRLAPTGLVFAAKPMWERACSRRRQNSQPLT
jgi:hypothetical protein